MQLFNETRVKRDVSLFRDPQMTMRDKILLN